VHRGVEPVAKLGELALTADESACCERHGRSLRALMLGERDANG
jgi:hypothetical protein